MLSTLEIATRLGVTSYEISQWSTRYRQHLSSMAAPGGGKIRRFVEEDMRVLTLVMRCREVSISYAEIDERLERGERLDPPQHPTVAAKDGEIRKLQDQIEQLQAKIAELERLNDYQQRELHAMASRNRGNGSKHE